MANNLGAGRQTTASHLHRSLLPFYVFPPSTTLIRRTISLVLSSLFRLSKPNLESIFFLCPEIALQGKEDNYVCNWERCGGQGLWKVGRFYLAWDIVGYWNDELYIVQLFSVGVDAEWEYGARRFDDEYYFKKQVEWQIVHPHFVRDADREQLGREFSIGDIVDVDEEWPQLPTMMHTRRKGVIVAKTLCTDQLLIGDGEPWLYTIKLETSGEIEADVLSFRMHPHRVWN